MEAGPAETRAEKAARIRPELFRLLLEFDPPEEERTEAEGLLVHAKEALQRQIQDEEEEAERERIEEAKAARLTHDRRPLRGSGFRGTCRTTREGGGLPEGPGIPAGITHDLVLQFDLPARRMEREERLLAMNGGDVNATLYEICGEGGGNDARFLLAHGADVKHCGQYGSRVFWQAAISGQLSVVEALLDAGEDELDRALVCASSRGHTSIAVLLLDRGADVHHEQEWALNRAACGGHLEIAAILLDRGADPNAHPHGTGPSLRMARDYGHREMVALLLARGAIDDAAS